MAIREAGLSIPADFAVVGFDDIPTAPFTHPPLTTIRTHAAEQGKLAGGAVITLIGWQRDRKPTRRPPARVDYPSVLRSKRNTEYPMRFSTPWLAETCSGILRLSRASERSLKASSLA